MVHKKIVDLLEIDEINRAIIRILKKNGKKPYIDIARELQISESTVRKRVSNLLKSGVIDKFTIELNPGFMKQNITSFIKILPRKGHLNNLLKTISNQSYCSQIFLLDGNMGLLIIVAVENPNELDALLETYRAHPEILEVDAGIILRNIKTGNCVANLF
jgi:Lrp/AsnC family transcriptional regulator of lysine biosynthesis